MSSEMNIQGLHHISIVCADAQRTVDFYTQVLDRVYFKSIYTTDPDGHIVELATAGPGFAVDETEANLGKSLQLPPWLEEQRSAIERKLKPITTPEWHAAESTHE